MDAATSCDLVAQAEHVQLLRPSRSFERGHSKQVSRFNTCLQQCGSLASESLVSTAKSPSRIDTVTSCDLVAEVEHVQLL